MSMHVRGKESGLILSERTDHIWTLKDGKLLRNESFREPGEALRELGLEPSSQTLAGSFHTPVAAASRANSEKSRGSRPSARCTPSVSDALRPSSTSPKR